MGLAFFFIVFTLIYFYLKNKNLLKYNFEKYFYNYKLLYTVLIFSVVIGFLLKLDFSENFGYFVHHIELFNLFNVLSSSISFAIIGIIYFVKSKKIKLAFHLIELVYWLLKLIIFKVGYAVGYAGMADTFIVTYDFLNLFLRLLLIRNLMFKLRTFLVAVISLIIMIFKIFVFSYPISMNLEAKKSKERLEVTIQKIQGNWEGQIIWRHLVVDTVFLKEHLIDTYPKNELLELIEDESTNEEEYNIIRVVEEEAYNVEISIDSNNFTIFRDTIITKYKLLFNREYSGSMILQVDSSILEKEDLLGQLYFTIVKIDKDSLVFFTKYDSNLSFKLVRKEN